MIIKLKKYIEGKINKYYILFINFFNKNLNQNNTHTSMDRYPKIFSTLKSIINNEKIKILSYGCSSGEECFTLNKYFPKSEIYGVDINKLSLRKAIKNNKYKNIKFIYSNNLNLQKYSKYDLIMCMSVLCRWPDTKGINNIEKIYSFDKFESTLYQLDGLLNKNGFLVIYNSNFSFKDSNLIKKYKQINIKELEKPFVKQFDVYHNKKNYIDNSIIFKKIYE